MTRTIAALALWLLAAPASAQPAAAPPPITLAELEAMALEAHPALRAADARLDTARGEAGQAGAWPNPVAGYSGEAITTGARERRGEHGFFVEQAIPLGGKLRLRQRVFERAFDRAEIERELDRQRVRTAVRLAFHDVVAGRHRVEIFERLAALGREAVGVTAQLFNTGAADRPDYLESEIEAQRIALALEEATYELAARRERLAAAVGVADIGGRALAGSIDDVVPDLDRDEVLAAILARHPALLAARVDRARAEAATALARRESFPDLFLRGGAAYNRERGEGSGLPIGWEGRVEAGVSLPLFDRNRGGIAAARADEARAAAEHERLELELRATLADAFAGYRTARRAATAYRTEILPRAEEAVRLYLARHREMAAAYPQVLVAQRGLFELSVQYLDSLERARAAATRIDGLLVAPEIPPAGRR